ncbi:MAG: mannose-1-phosphate guanylyltransferase/mannose-6-phosphate isomerase [Cryobacterium sp.]|nr:mannose-1-phosphate guanylyltransferase/mannose-6-phosphate isomerase [Oligoflexia bacterium]
MTSNFIPFVLCGGSGTRLWPKSRASLPKQYCDFFGVNLFQTTLNRFGNVELAGIVSTESQLPLIQRSTPKEMAERGGLIQILEPFGKNTAAAVAVAVRRLVDLELGHSVIGIFPADHYIEDEKKFLKTVDAAVKKATDGSLVTLGIEPTFPATGYGYIETDSEPLSSGGDARRATKFHEKPSESRAVEYLASGRFFWNAGIFIARVDTLAHAFETHAKDLWASVLKIEDILRPTKGEYEAIPSISFDVAIMEKLPEHVCIPVACGWSDVGSWDSLISTLGRNAKDDGHTTKIDSERSTVISHREREYVLIDCPDVNVVDTEDAVLVFKTGSSEKVKIAYESLKKKKSKVSDTHPFEYRPWGHFEILRDTEDFKSKVIEVLPGQRLSYQSHKKRAEHWIIIKGEPEVTLNDEVLKLKAGEYVYIPLGAKHRISNPTKETVQFVEVQVGTYFGEDDITRYQDDYRRM